MAKSNLSPKFRNIPGRPRNESPDRGAAQALRRASAGGGVAFICRTTGKRCAILLSTWGCREYASPWTRPLQPVGLLRSERTDPLTGRKGLLKFAGRDGNPRQRTDPNITSPRDWAWPGNLPGISYCEAATGDLLKAPGIETPRRRGSSDSVKAQFRGSLI
jgi:hypothetical protein